MVNNIEKTMLILLIALFIIYRLLSTIPLQAAFFGNAQVSSKSKNPSHGSYFYSTTGGLLFISRLNGLVHKTGEV